MALNCLIDSGPDVLRLRVQRPVDSFADEGGE
jgi:hypothetical protein